MATVELDIPDVFAELLEPHRYKVYYGGRGAAKTRTFAAVLLALGMQKPLRVLCAREIQRSLSDSVKQTLEDRIAEHEPFAEHYEIKKTEIVGANGTRFLFEGLRHNINTIRSMEGIDVCWVEEAAAVSEESWKVLIPTIRAPGSEIWISFNPESEHDPVWRRFVESPAPDSVVRRVSWRDNPWFPDVLRDEMQHDVARDPDMARHIWEGAFLEFPDGAIYRSQIERARAENRIGSIPLQPGAEVYTFWDLGRNDHTAIWFMQSVGAQNRFIDYYEHRLVDLPHYFRVLRGQSEDVSDELNERRAGYLYGTVYLPHDVEHEILGAERTRLEQFVDAGFRDYEVVPRIRDLQEGIEMTRAAFASAWFDEEFCSDGLRALSRYHYVYDEVARTHRMRPAHDEYSHGADAFRQYGQGWVGRHANAWAKAKELQMSDRRRAALSRNRKQVTTIRWRV